MNSYNNNPKPCNAAPLPPLRSTRLLDQVRERIRYLHYSLRTERAYVYWVRAFVRFHGLRHPREMGAPEVTAFLSWLAGEKQVSPSTHRQALSALLFLYGQVLGADLPWMSEIVRPKTREKVPVVLSTAEVSRLLDALQGSSAVLGRLMYGTGLRLMEALRLRVKDIDFERHEIVVRDGKGGKDRRVMLPAALAEPLHGELARARLLWDQDRARGLPTMRSTAAATGW